ncbi:MAG: alpha/beta fold hydrolase [Rhodobacteraceae bacterium]|nr:alpha/beta fold hydrolase [Paracoccaceae bacterium]
MAHLAPDGTIYDLQGRDTAPVIVLIHGLGLNREVWQWLIPALTKEYRVLSFDLSGHGGSTPPPVRPSLTMFSDQLTALMDHCEIETATIAGFSLGGMIARRFAQDHPARCAALIILHSPHQRSEHAQSAIIRRVEQARRAGPASTVEAALERWFTDDYRKNNSEMMDLVRRWVKANDSAIYHTIYRVLADGVDEITAPIPPVKCPMLVITGDEDYGNGPEMTQAIAAEVTGAQIHILAGLRHMALLENPDAVNVPIRAFLDRNLAGDHADV